MNRAYFLDHVNVRAGPSVETEKVAQYHPGERVNYDGVVVYSEGREWLTYTGKSGKRRYVSAEDTIRFGYM